MAGRKIRDAREARECLEAAATSRMDRAAWARAHGIDGRSLNAWRLNLERSERPHPSPEAVRLVELVPMSAASRVQPIRIRCDPFVVEVGAEFDDEALTRILEIVASC